MSRILAHIEFRLAIPADAMTISEMSRDLIETGLGWSWTRRRVDHAIRNRDTLAVTAMQGSEVAGFGIMEFGDETAHLSLFAVRMELHRRGIGTAMFEWLRQSALTAGIVRIGLELRALNGQAEAFYRAQGFAPTARVPGYYRGREHALRMALDLRKSRR